MSPELLYPERFNSKHGRPTKESDCYALGMVVYEVLSGQKPFGAVKSSVVIYKVVDGQRPERLQGKGGKLFTDAVWEVLESCWKPQPSERKSAKAVLLGLEGVLLPSRPPSPDVDGGQEADSDRSDTTSSYSSSFSPFFLRPASNYPYGVSGPPITSGGYELPDPSRTNLDNVASPGPSTHSSTLVASTPHSTRTDGSKTIPEDLGPSFPQTRQETQGPPPKPEEHAGAPNPRTSGVPPPCTRESIGDTKPIVGDHGVKQEQEGQGVSGPRISSAGEVTEDPCDAPAS